MNYGSCTSYDEMPDDFYCSCQPPYDGKMCEYKENPCVWPAEPGICDQMIPRYYYDRFAQECLPFNYTGMFLFVIALILQYSSFEDP